VRADGKRFPGSFGSAFMYPIVPNVVLFREEHSRRTLVPKVEFVSARGDPCALLTGKALFSWNKERKRFRLDSIHPGESVDSIAAQTGFDYDAPAGVPATPPPTAEDLALLRGPVAKTMAADYPDFARRLWGV
jgi:glutaconate CoA-transferase subunit B